MTSKLGKKQRKDCNVSYATNALKSLTGSVYYHGIYLIYCVSQSAMTVLPCSMPQPRSCSPPMRLSLQAWTVTLDFVLLLKASWNSYNWIIPFLHSWQLQLPATQLTGLISADSVFFWIMLPSLLQGPACFLHRTEQWLFFQPIHAGIADMKLVTLGVAFRAPLKVHFYSE